MVVLCLLFKDFRSFQYTVPKISGLLVSVTKKDTTIKLPQTRYDEVSIVYLAHDFRVCFKRMLFNTSCFHFFAFSAVLPQRKIGNLGIFEALFEGSMIAE